MREALRELCEEIDRRARSSVLTCAGLAALALSGCADPRFSPAAPDGGADARTSTGKDGRSVDVPHAVGVYSAPGCSFSPVRRP